MSPEQLKHILLKELGGTEDGDAITISSRVTVLLTGKEGVVPVAKVSGVRFTNGLLCLLADDGRFFCDDQTVFGIRCENETQSTEKRPGFH